jgi:hypothetical protein
MRIAHAVVASVFAILARNESDQELGTTILINLTGKKLWIASYGASSTYAIA